MNMGDIVKNEVLTNKDNVENNMTNNAIAKCTDQINLSATPSGGENRNYSSKQAAKLADGERYERKKKTRRGKPKRKNPYNKEDSSNRSKYQKRRSISKFRNRQPVAPYNTNQFLMNDHTDLQGLDERLLTKTNTSVEVEAPNSPNSVGNRPARARDSSFTSADSVEDFFYSSPDDETEFLTKEFSNTYKDLHVESLASMSKADLIQQLIQLEEKVDFLQKKMNSRNNDDDKISEDEAQVRVKSKRDYENEISRLSVINQQLEAENERLRKRIQSRNSSMDSETLDSESDSSSSSATSSRTSGSGRNSPNVKEAPEEVIVNGNHSLESFMEKEDMT
ncbi:protein HEXIM1 [Nilaparvata lugens]|uniref:protein HEXIM1 n=1 Tax=Nilaparvata lugens TaxID=108931 RepID=UPI000B990CAC|nr:protein HEXIM1 [Nilaparvata lugens]